MRDRLLDAIARFDEVVVVSELQRAVALAAPNRGQYRLSANAAPDQAGKLDLTFRLIDMVDSRIVWTRVVADFDAADASGTTIDDVVTRLAVTLVQPYGVIYARETARSMARVTITAIAVCSKAWNSAAAAMPKDHATAQSCLTQFGERRPGLRRRLFRARGTLSVGLLP